MAVTLLVPLILVPHFTLEKDNIRWLQVFVMEYISNNNSTAFIVIKHSEQNEAPKLSEIKLWKLVLELGLTLL